MTPYLRRGAFAYLLLLLCGTAAAQNFQLEHPLIGFNTEGSTFYDPGSAGSAGSFRVFSIPVALQEQPGANPIPISQPAELTIAILVDENGLLAGGTAGVPDLQISGTLSGATQILLEGEVLAFSVSNSDGPTDIYAMTFEVTGGTLAADYASTNAGVELTSENSSFDGTFDKPFSGKAKGTVGRIALATACNLTLDKSCLVVTPASDDLACTSKIAAARFRYIGPGFDGISEVEIVGGSGASASYSVELNQNQTVLADQNGFSIDATISGEDDLGSRTSIFINGVEEELHTSCSVPFVAGQPAPLNDPKGDPSSNWLVEAFIDKDGNEISLPDAQFAQSCEIPTLGNTECEQRPSAIQFRYTGADCTASSNNQSSDKFECHDFGSTNGPVDILVFKDSDIYANVSGATLGTIIDATAANAGQNDFGSETLIEIRDTAGNLLQSIRLHTSCSQPLALGDRFGGMDLISFTNDEQGTVQNGAEVIYRYAIANPGPSTATNIIVTDSGLTPAEVPGSPIALLLGGQSHVLEATTFIDAATAGTAMLSATVDGQTCETSDSTPITIATPPPCNMGSDGFELKDDAFKWQLSNPGSNNATISSISISWPVPFGALKEIKLDGKIFDDIANPPSATIDSFIGNLDNRQLEAGETRTLEFKFDEKYKQAQPGDFLITVSFAEGCEITFTPGSIPPEPFDCDGKIRELTLLWDGMIEPVNIRAYAGAPGSELLLESGDLFITDRVVVGDFSVAGAPNDVFFEVFDSAGHLLGESKFHRSCSDDEMDGLEDCGMPQGNGKNNDSGFLNDWALDGLADDNSSFTCTDN